MSIKISVIYLCLFSLFGCAKLDSYLAKALTTSANVSLEAIDKNKSIAKYDYGALIETDGKELAEKAMNEFCSYKKYRIITKGSRVSGEKKFAFTMVFECID